MRNERFEPILNGQPIDSRQQRIRYAANGRDTRVHTVTLGPYLENELALTPMQLVQGRNVIELLAANLVPNLQTTVNLREVELLIRY